MTKTSQQEEVALVLVLIATLVQEVMVFAAKVVSLGYGHHGGQVAIVVLVSRAKGNQVGRARQCQLQV